MSSGSQRICVCACVCASHMCAVGMRDMQCQLQNPANPRNVGFTYICNICNFETTVAMLFHIFGKNFNQFSKNYSYIFNVAFWAYGFQNKRWIIEAISSKQNSTHILVSIRKYVWKLESGWLICYFDDVFCTFKKTDLKNKVKMLPSPAHDIFKFKKYSEL